MGLYLYLYSVKIYFSMFMDKVNNTNNPTHADMRFMVPHF